MFLNGPKQVFLPFEFVKCLAWWTGTFRNQNDLPLPNSYLMKGTLLNFPSIMASSGGMGKKGFVEKSSTTGPLLE